MSLCEMCRQSDVCRQGVVNCNPEGIAAYSPGLVLLPWDERDSSNVTTPTGLRTGRNDL